MLRSGSNTFAISSYSRIQTQNLSQGVYVYSAVKNATPANIEEIKKTRGFSIALSTLLRGYSHFLVSPQIRDILITENP